MARRVIELARGMSCWGVCGRLGGSELIVAEIADQLVGTVAYYPEASRSALERWPVGDPHARRAPHARGRGVGEALACESLCRARAREAAAVGLLTNPFMAAANRLYARLGFRRAPEFDIKIGEMFTGRRLPPDASWQAQAFRLDLKEA
jgi:ribosomal protein S18 acetylase RimI-like enzyme